jgi:hypothetical protein
MNNFFADSLRVFSSNIFSILLSFLAGVIIARCLGPENKGLYTSILVIPLLVQSLCEMGLRQATTFYLGKKYFDEIKFIANILSLSIVTSVIACVVTIAVFYIQGVSDFLYILLASVYLCINIMIAYIGGVFLGKDLISKYNSLRWIPNIINIFLLIIMLYVLKLGVFGALFSLVLSNMFVLFLNIRFLFRKYGYIYPQYDRLISVRILKLGLVYGISLFIINLNYKINILMLTEMVMPSELGIYTLGESFAELLWQIPSALGVVIISKSVTQKNQDELSRDILSLLRISLFIVSVCSIILYFISPWVIPFIYGEDYIESVSVIRATLPGIIFMVVFKILNSRLAGIGKPYYAIYAFIPSIMLNILLNIVFIPKYGIIGSVLSTNISWAIAICILVFFYSKLTNATFKQIFIPTKTDLDALCRK